MYNTAEDSMTAISSENELNNKLKKREEDVMSPAYTSMEAEKKYKKLKTLFELQKRMVQKNMHKAMSPISAMSGYLELMRMFLEDDVDKEKIEQYRTKIQEGVDELGEIVEELYEAFHDHEDDKEENDFIVKKIKSNRRAS